MLSKPLKSSFFSNSIQVFFPWVAIIAIMVPMYTVTTIVNAYPFQNSFFTLFEWHGFEMIFSFFYTFAMGYLLVAGARWNNQEPINRKELILLFLFWAFEQLCLFFSPHLTLLLVSTILLFCYFFYLLVKTLKDYLDRWKILISISIFSLCKVTYIIAKILKDTEVKHAVYELTTLLICTLTLRHCSNLIPRVTKDQLTFSKELTVPDWLEKSSNLFLWTLPLAILTPYKNLAAILFFTTGILQLLKLTYWKFLSGIKFTMAGMLHFGFLSIAGGFIIKGFSYHFDFLTDGRATLHLLLTGGASIIVLNIMIRETLSEDKLGMRIIIKAMYFFIVLGMLIRFLVPIISPEFFIKSLHHSMGHWTMAFLIYLITYFYLCFKKNYKSSL